MLGGIVLGCAVLCRAVLCCAGMNEPPGNIVLINAFSYRLLARHSTATAMLMSMQHTDSNAVVTNATTNTSLIQGFAMRDCIPDSLKGCQSAVA